MERGTTPAGDEARLKPGCQELFGVGVPAVDLGRVDRLLRAARDAAGLAAYHYFFRTSTLESRAAYLAAIEAEAEAELLLLEVRSTRLE